MSKITSMDPAVRDAQFWKRLDDILKRQKFGVNEAIRFFPAYMRRRELPRLLVHYELFKMIMDLPGSIVELGVYTGSTLLTWSKLMETFCASDRSRKVFGFDHFKGLTEFTQEDGRLDSSRDKFQDAYVFDGSTIVDLVDLHNDDNIMPGVERCRLVLGDLRETIPQFIEENPGLRISLLHLDVDLYDPTKVGLELLYPLVVRGGVIVFDEYALPPWEGETAAANAVFKKFGINPIIRKFPFSSQPSGYFVKE